MKYLLSISVRKREAKWIDFHSSLFSRCCSTAPKPERLASQIIRTSAVRLKCVFFCNFLNAFLNIGECLIVLLPPVPAFRSFQQGSERIINLAKLGLNWFISFTAPKNERNFFWVFGFKRSVMSWTLLFNGLILSEKDETRITRHPFLQI